MGFVNDPHLLDLFDDTALFVAGVAAGAVIVVLGWMTYKFGRWQ